MPYNIRTKDGIVIQGIPDDVKPDDPSIKQRVLKARDERSHKTGDWVTGEQSFLDNAFAGAGKALADIPLGIRQLVGMAPQSEVDEVKKRDEALMNSGGGITGNILTQIGMALAPGGGLLRTGKAIGSPGLAAAGKAILSAPATLGGAATSAGMGALQSGIQPVATGDSRAKNMMIGGAAGAAVPVAGMALKGASAAVEPLYEGGRNQIIGRALREAAGPNVDDAVRGLSNAPQLVPGSLPTAGEAAGSPGIAAMQRAAAAVDPEAYGRRAIEQNAARVNALRSVAGDEGQKTFFEASRKTAADDLYKQAFDKGTDIFRDPATGQFLPKNVVAGVKGEITNLTKRPAVQEAIDRARKLAANEGFKIDDPSGSVRGLHYVKTALDDMIEQAGKRGQANEQRILVGLKDRMLTTIDRLSPDYAQARVTFREMSKPINQMEVGESILNKSTSALESMGGQPRLYPENLARALREADQTAQRATGFSGARMADVMDPAQMATLNAVKDDLGRNVFSQNAGRGAGSDTVQKLAMSNLMQRSGLPMGVVNIPGVGRAGNWAYQNADELMKLKLAQALLDPKATAQIMKEAAPNVSTEMIAKALRATLTPAAIGGAAGSLNFLQQ